MIHKQPSAAERIRGYVLARIEGGEWPSGYKVPSEAELMSKFGVSRMTVHRAIKELAAEGTVYRHRGKGTFVAESVPRSQLLQVRDISDEVAGRGNDHFAQVAKQEMARMTPYLHHVFGPEVEKYLAHSRVVHFENGVPLQLEERWVDLRHGPDYLDIDLTETTSHQYLMRTAPLQKAEHELTAVLPDVEQQDLLKIKALEPCMLLRRRTWSSNDLVSYAELLYPGSRYSFGGVFTPE